jgi:hypothetical protein
MEDFAGRQLWALVATTRTPIASRPRHRSPRLASEPFQVPSALSADAADALGTRGFVVLPGPYSADELPRLQAAYDDACAHADQGDVGIGRTSTRVSDFVNRGETFDSIYTWPPALDAANRVIRGEFRLSAFQARTVRPGAPAQELHADVPRSSDAWPMLGLILMVDEFRADNGATRFVPGSHRWTELPESVLADRIAPYPGDVLACGRAGSVILFDASTWHGHTANTSRTARRSLQGTFIPRSSRPATDFVGRLRPETLLRLSAVARYLIGVEPTIAAPS